MTIKLTTNIALALSILLPAMSVPAFAQSAPPSYGPPIDVTRAKKVAGAAMVEAVKRHLDMTIVVVDSGGNLVYLERYNQAAIGTIDPAIGKAKAANGIKSATKGMGDMIVKGQVNLLGVPGGYPIPGGVPIIDNNKVVGAIGVSGGMLTDDDAVANAGAQGLKNNY